MFFFDPLQLLVIGVGVVLSLWASFKVKGTFQTYSQKGTRAGLTGAQVAERILSDHGIRDVRVEPVAGDLTDHYDPTQKVLRLSERVYGSHSMSAVGVAAHEVGHAIQHAEGYAALRFRSAWVPVAATGSQISIFVLIAAAFMGGAHGGSPLGTTLAWVGVLLFATTTVFTLVTLPVEFDASNRALATLRQGRYLQEDELVGAKKVLDAAAMTYVAAFVSSLLMLIYWVYRLGLAGRSDD